MHAEASLAPVVLLNVAFGQGMQADSESAASTGLNVPDSHNRHSEAPGVIP